MKIVFEHLESSLTLVNDMVNVMRFADSALFSRCALSLAQGFSAESLEPAHIFENDIELKAKDVFTFAGDLLVLDLDSRDMAALANRKLISMFVEDDNVLRDAGNINCQMEALFETQLHQLDGDYYFKDEWDAGKYMKALGFGIDTSLDVTLFDKSLHYLKLAADLFPSKILVFVNLNTYLRKEQYEQFCKQAVANDLTMLLYETGNSSLFEDFENGIFIGMDYLEY